MKSKRPAKKGRTKKRPTKKRPTKKVAPTAKGLKARAAEYYRRLATAYPDAHCALDHADPYQLLVETW